MAREQRPQFKNIVLQDADGTVHVFEPGAKGLNVVLLVLQEEGPNAARIMIRSAYTLLAGGILVHELLKANPDLGPAVMAASMKELVDQIKASEREKGGPPNEPVQ